VALTTGPTEEEDTALGSEGGKRMGSVLLGGCSRGQKLTLGLRFELGGPQCDDIFITFRGLRLD